MPETTPTGSVAIQISKTAGGKFKFTSSAPTGSGITFDDAPRQATINELGTFLLSYTMDGFEIKDPGITWGESPAADPTPPTGYTVNEVPNGSSFTVEVTTALTGGAQTASFLIHQDSTTDVIDPTILVEPPGGQIVDFDRLGTGTLLVSAALEPDKQLVYKEQVRDTPYLEWLPDILSARVSNEGLYYLVYGTDFELGIPAIEFPNGQPEYIELTQTGHLAILTLRVSKGQPHEQVLLKINMAFPDPGVNNEPTILVEPPGGVK
ncbi:MAG: hypothetical protein ABJC13_23260 [Acidobacteriota bacterium]